LEQAVRRLKSLPPAAKWEVNVDLPLAAYIPRSYVSDLRLKIDLYRRIGRIRTREELESLAAELDDRFAHPPPPVVALFELAAARIDAARWGITSVHREENYIVLQYSDPALIEQLAKQATSELRIVDGRSAYVPLPQNARSGSDVFDLVRRLLATGTQRGSADLTGCIEARGERSDFQSNQAVDRGGRAFGAP
jgi:transcription-repair coupling factor (superfamily II helicase)